MGAPAKDGVPDFDASGLSDEELAGAIMMLGYFEGALVRALQVASAENRRREAARGGDATQEAPMSPVAAGPEMAPITAAAVGFCVKACAAVRIFAQRLACLRLIAWAADTRISRSLIARAMSKTPEASKRSRQARA